MINTIDSSITTAKSGRIIVAGNSGTVGVGVGDEVAVGVAVGFDDVGKLVGDDVGLAGASGFGVVKKGTKVTFPELKSFLKS